MNSPIRVAHIMGKMVGGGVEQVVMNYFRHIDRSLFQFDFLVDADSTLVPKDEIELLGGRVFEIPPYQHLIAYQRALVRLFRQERWSIVHSHVNALSVFPLRVAKRVGVPVRIAHSHSTAGMGEPMKNAAKAALRRFSNAYPTARLACGEKAGSWLFGEAPFEILPNAIDISEFTVDGGTREAIRGELGIPDEAFVVGHIGRMVPQKNHRRLLSIFKKLLLIEPGAILVLAGDGPLMGCIREEAVRLGVAERIHFLGQRSDAKRLYQLFDVFCLPSAYEGLPVVGVECQACGTPILASTEVSVETAITSLMEYESLSSSDGEWARRLREMRGKTASLEDLKSIEQYDIRANAMSLCDIYKRCLGTEE